MIKFNKVTIEADIATVTGNEKVTKAVLRTLSRELLAYVYETKDTGMVERLIAGLTPMNKRVAVAYFPSFLGWSFDADKGTFGKKIKDGSYAKKLAKTEEWLEDEANDIWKFDADSLAPPVAKAKAYAEKITKLINKALKDEEQGITKAELRYAILASDDVTLADMMVALDDVVMGDIDLEAMAEFDEQAA
jgi:hypothetical protein